MGTVVLDASVLLGFLNPGDALAEECRDALALIIHRMGMLPSRGSRVGLHLHF